MAREPQVPGTLGVLDERFELLSQLGRGGMGIVYRAFDRERGVQVAVKTLQSLEPDQVLRLKAEFRALRDLRHPNLVELGELIEQNGNWFFTMELVEGATFIDHVRGAVQLQDWSVSSESMEGSATASETEATLPSADRGADRPTVRELGGRAQQPQCDLQRLRKALAGLARGLVRLHEAGKVHRDVKPSNIVVAPDGRVVLLDFGVVAELAASRAFERGRLIGTASYMAPEQAARAEVGPAADWYAVGVMLFEALTGRLPFAGDRDDILARKQAFGAPWPSDVADGVPAELDRLCAQLLERDPARRATAPAVFDVVGADRSAEAAAWVPPSTEGRLFVGRAEQLDALRGAFAASREHAVCVFVEGESGVGKSALVDHFARTVSAEDEHLLVLRGRCHERERVPYNAFDGVVDDLTRHLLGRLPSRVDRLVPDGVDALLQLFPALRTVESFARRAGERPTRSASEVRRDAFAAVRALLGRLGARRAVLLVVDDVQWADGDSVVLLEEIARGADAPAVCIVATQRSGTGRAVSAEVGRVAQELRRIELGGLTEAESSALAEKLLAGVVRSVDAGQITAEAGGHPMFIRELVHHAAQRHAAGEPLLLDEALRTRVRALDADARALLEAVAVAGAPIAQEIAFAAAGTSRAAVAASVPALQSGRLIHVRGGRRTDPIEPYHDRVREAVYVSLDDDRRRQLHGAIASGLEAAGAPPEALFEHFEAAGLADRARQYLEAAADAAFVSMAFARAAELYRRALAEEHDPDRRAALHETLGDALSNDGRSVEAAECYMDAARAAGDPMHALDLQRRAAERFLMSGHHQRGLEAARLVLRELGMSMPSLTARIIAGILWNQYRLRRHPLTWTQRSPTERGRLAANVFWSFGSGLSMVEILRGAYFASRSPLLALEHGEPTEIARALSGAAVSAAITGRGDEVDKLLDATRRAADEADTPLARYWAQHARSATLFVHHNDWRGCLELVPEIRRLWRECGRGSGWETDVITHFECSSYQLLGEYGRLEGRVREAVREAELTGNLFLEVSLRVRFAGRFLVRGDWQRAKSEIDDALAAWLPESDTFGNQRAWALWSMTRVAHCSDDFNRFVPELDDQWRTMRRSLTARVKLMQIEWRATTAPICAARRCRPGAAAPAASTPARWAKPSSTPGRWRACRCRLRHRPSGCCAPPSPGRRTIKTARWSTPAAPCAKRARIPPPCSRPR